MRLASLVTWSATFAVGLANVAPTSTAPLQPRAAVTTLFTPTEYWTYATTSVSKDEYFMGIVKVTSPDGLWYLRCMREPLTTRNGFGGCGRDDLYTSCSGNMALGIDGEDIRCGGGYQCVTHKIFEDFEAYSSSSYTPFLGCGKRTASLEMIRTPPASFEAAATTSGASASTGNRPSSAGSTTATMSSPGARHSASPTCLAVIFLLALSFVL